MDERSVGEWLVVHERTTAGDAHGRDLPVDRRGVHVLDVTSSAIVVGSTQPFGDVDEDAARSAGIDVVRRRSGGGAVLLAAGAQLWVDVIVPRDDVLWDDDVARASHWLGDAWSTALATVGVADAVVHRGAMRSSTLSPVVCFAGLGPGEVTVDGAKCVGISQRRTREAARFQCSVPGSWDVPLHARLLGPGLRRVGASVGDIDAIAVHTIDDLGSLLGAFEAALPR